MSSLGKPGTPATPAATRAVRAGWRDPRLWIGLLIVAGSVVLGARVMSAADDTVSVWAVIDDHGAGSQLGGDDVVAVRVRFTGDADLDRYVAADRPLATGIVLARGVGAGELLPRAAIGSRSDATTVQVPVDIEPAKVPPDVAPGSVVDVYVGRPLRGGDVAGPVLAAVTVVAAPPVADSFALTGTRQLVLAVEDDAVAGFLSVLDGLDDPVVRVVQRS
ncbi:flagellar biosynthesis protein FlgA [Nocardioides humilatus]|uniref:Flagellar biosynthesis protein FlgA n=1 Tax=Nocardioides humilatus TaxID=2607660 RepID=A0A5B1LE42_9ACTN|nr:flagellar biosynthesis protein FlgA [Nocardioides humilatus]KAA1418716.1 flagellar biosynthesis protein FlgA [Nocardioides humilatus]